MRRVYTSTHVQHPAAVTVGSLVFASLASLAVGRLAVDQGSVRMAVVAVLACGVVGLGFVAPRALLLSLVVWLAALGVLRRVVTLRAGGISTDPLLLVGPLAVAVLVLLSAQAGAFKRPTVLSNAVLVLSALACLGALNPLQGSMSAGVAGLLFVLVPMLSFWVGRGLVVDRTLARILMIVGGVALVTAAYGLWQTFAGFPRWDTNWIANSDFVALNVESTVRPFSTFSSPQEFGSYLAIAIITWLSFGLSARRIPITVGAVSLLGAALLYESSRTIVVFLIAAVGICLAARRGLRLPVALAAGAAFVVGLSAVAGHFANEGIEGTPSALVAHQIAGLADPFSSESTAVGHISLVVGGVRSVITNPVGNGVSAVTMAGSKFGGLSQGTEADPSNAAVGLGLPGLLVYLVVLASGLTLAYRTAASRRDALSIAALGIVVVTVFQWLNGGQYAVAFLPWLVLGWADRQRADLDMHREAGLRDMRGD